jgi:F-box-like
MGISGTQTLSRASVTPRKTFNPWFGEDEGGGEPEPAFKAHPLGVKPIGNALAACDNSTGGMGIFGRLPDETILMLLEWLDSKSLLHLGASCRSFFAYTTCDQLWKDLFILYAESLFLHLTQVPHLMFGTSPDPSAWIMPLFLFQGPGACFARTRVIGFLLSSNIVMMLTPAE